MAGFSIACLIASVVLVGFHYSRARFNLSHLPTITLFPLASGLACFLQDEIKDIDPDNLNPFILCTTAGLGVLAYSLLRSRFLEIRPRACTESDTRHDGHSRHQRCRDRLQPPLSLFDDA